MKQLKHYNKEKVNQELFKKGYSYWDRAQTFLKLRGAVITGEYKEEHRAIFRDLCERDIKVIEGVIEEYEKCGNLEMIKDSIVQMRAYIDELVISKQALTEAEKLIEKEKGLLRVFR